MNNDVHGCDVYRICSIDVIANTQEKKLGRSQYMFPLRHLYSDSHFTPVLLVHIKTNYSANRHKIYSKEHIK